MKFKLFLFFVSLTLVLTLSAVSASYPSVAMDQRASPDSTVEGEYVFVVDAPTGAFASVVVVIEGKLYGMTFVNNRWIALVPGASPGDSYYYRFRTTGGMVFESARSTL